MKAPAYVYYCLQDVGFSTYSSLNLKYFHCRYLIILSTISLWTHNGCFPTLCYQFSLHSFDKPCFILIASNTSLFTLK